MCVYEGLHPAGPFSVDHCKSSYLPSTFRQLNWSRLYCYGPSKNFSYV